jgi:hypothetical protein
MVMNTNLADLAVENTATASSASFRRGKKAVQFILPETLLRIAGSTPAPLTRKQAIGKVKRWLQKPTLSPVRERKAKSLMYLFRLEAEELLEAGVAYENVCALQRHWLI